MVGVGVGFVFVLLHVFVFVVVAVQRLQEKDVVLLLCCFHVQQALHRVMLLPFCEVVVCSAVVSRDVDISGVETTKG